MGTSTYSGTAEGGQQVAAHERFAVVRAVDDWHLHLGEAFFRIDQYGKVCGWSAPSDALAVAKPRMTAAWDFLKARHWRGRARRFSDAKREGLKTYAHLLNEAGL